MASPLDRMEILFGDITRLPVDALLNLPMAKARGF